jgi:hypothetical protein
MVNEISQLPPSAQSSAEGLVGRQQVGSGNPKSLPTRLLRLFPTLAHLERDGEVAKALGEEPDEGVARRAAHCQPHHLRVELPLHAHKSSINGCKVHTKSLSATYAALSGSTHLGDGLALGLSRRLVDAHEREQVAAEAAKGEQEPAPLDLLRHRD